MFRFSTQRNTFNHLSHRRRAWAHEFRAKKEQQYIENANGRRLLKYAVYMGKMFLDSRVKSDVISPSTSVSTITHSRNQENSSPLATNSSSPRDTHGPFLTFVQDMYKHELTDNKVHPAIIHIIKTRLSQLSEKCDYTPKPASTTDQFDYDVLPPRQSQYQIEQTYKVVWKCVDLWFQSPHRCRQQFVQHINNSLETGKTKLFYASTIATKSSSMRAAFLTSHKLHSCGGSAIPIDNLRLRLRQRYLRDKNNITEICSFSGDISHRQKLNRWNELSSSSKSLWHEKRVVHDCTKSILREFRSIMHKISNDGKHTQKYAVQCGYTPAFQNTLTESTTTQFTQ